MVNNWMMFSKQNCIKDSSTLKSHLFSRVKSLEQKSNPSRTEAVLCTRPRTQSQRDQKESCEFILSIFNVCFFHLRDFTT